MKRPGRQVRTSRGAYAPNRLSTPRRSYPKQGGGVGQKRFLFGFIIVVALLFIYSRFNVETIKIEGNRVLKTPALETIIRAGLQATSLSGNLLTLNPSRVEDYVVLKEYQVKDLKFKRHWPQTLVVEVTERKPSLLWQSGEQVNVLDIDGTVIGSAGERFKQLPVVIDSKNVPVRVGDRVVSGSFIQFCDDVVTQLQSSLAIGVSRITVPDTTSEVHVTTSKGYVVKFDTTRSAISELNDLKNVLSELDRLRKVPAEYIDLRIPGKAYYK